MTPQEHFLKTPAAKRFLEIVDDPAYRAAVETVLLQFVARCQPCADMQIAAANGYRLEGARGVLAMLNELPVAPKPITQPTTANLKHRV